MPVLNGEGNEQNPILVFRKTQLSTVPKIFAKKNSSISGKPVQLSQLQTAKIIQFSFAVYPTVIITPNQNRLDFAVIFCIFV